MDLQDSGYWVFMVWHAVPDVPDQLRSHDASTGESHASRPGVAQQA
jgi:hypothetical protein